jgi:hypothetical protein
MPPTVKWRKLKLVSGGQTGADRAAIDFAVAHGIPYGGWCPKGRKAEDGPLDPRYQLKETPSPAYSQRTEWNVRDSDATVVFTVADKLAGGSQTTMEFARRHGKPCLHLAAERSGKEVAAQLEEFIRKHNIRILNLAGSRGSEEPGVGAFVARTLRTALTRKSQTRAAGRISGCSVLFQVRIAG